MITVLESPDFLSWLWQKGGWGRFRPIVGLTHPHVYSVPSIISPGVKWPLLEAEQSRTSSVNINPYKAQAQTALFKAPVRTAL